MAVESVRLDHAAHKRPRGQVAWCLFDWANSPFPTIVGTFLFANYFARADLLEAWVEARKPRVDRLNRLLEEIRASDSVDLAMLAVANRQLRSLVAS